MQTFNTPLKLSDINFDNIVYKDIKSNSNKTVIFLKYKDNNTLRNLAIQTPSLININNPIKKGNHWDLDVPLTGKKTEKVNEFATFLNKLDQKVIYDARINSSKWFQNFDTDEMNYQEIIRTSDDKRFSNGIVRVKLIKNNDFHTIVQLNNKTNIGIDKIPKNSWVKMIIEVHAIWINKNGFGIFLKPVLISFNPIELNKYRFIEDSEDEVDDVIDSENCVFIASNHANNKTNDLETSNLRLVNDSLDIDASTKFSSTSSDNKQNSTVSSSSDNDDDDNNDNVDDTIPINNVNI
jgi:hypothetical protein|uniref:Uncharacterized protein n=1 Tax=viral metagenome TaxID=1070528 RepID=A0A6C0IT28_9ZZZZ